MLSVQFICCWGFFGHYVTEDLNLNKSFSEISWKARPKAKEHVVGFSSDSHNIWRLTLRHSSKIFSSSQCVSVVVCHCVLLCRPVFRCRIITKNHSASLVWATGCFLEIQEAVTKVT